MYFHLIAGIAAFVLSALTLGVLAASIHRANRRNEAIASAVLSENKTIAGQLIRSVIVPCTLLDGEGRIHWRNRAFSEIFEGNHIDKLLPGFDAAALKRSMVLEDNSGRTYEVHNMTLTTDSGRNMIFQCYLNRTEAAHYQRLYEEQMPAVCLVYVDNYEDLSPDQYQRATILAEVERRIAEWVTELGGVYRRYDVARFFVVFERAKMEEIEKKRFALLDIVHNLNLGGETPVTLSIAAGIAPRIKESDENAKQAMELALGRGGDQAVLKTGASFKFYGGQQGGVRQSRVKARLFAKALRQLMENSTEIFITGHKQPDMDCIGAALGILRCARSARCRGYIILEKDSAGIEQLLELMKNKSEYASIIVSPEQAKLMFKPLSVLVVVDTQRWSAIPMQDMEKTASRLVVIDHHKKTTDTINATLSYLEPNASSVCEMVTEVVQHFGDDIRLSAVESGAMLAGISVDTKNFAFNVSARTFESASFLRRSGADSAMVKQMFQDDMLTYVQRSEVVRNAELITDKIALAICPNDIPNASLIAAQAADALISIRGIHASFVLARHGDELSISGRSIGDIDVQAILEKLGGGGHLTIAGAQLKGVCVEDAVENIRHSVNSYLAGEEATI